MNKNDLSNLLSEYTGLKNDYAYKLFLDIFNCVSDILIEHDDGVTIVIPNFGTFSKKKKNGYYGVDPRNGEKKWIEEKNIIVFNPSKTMKYKINNRTFIEQ